MQDIDRHTFPNGGWMFRQPQTGWVNPYAMVSFNDSVRAIIKHRQANRAMIVKHNLSTDFNTVADELEDYTRKRLGLPAKGSASTPFPYSPSSPSFTGVAAGIKRAAQGTSVILDWLQAGGKPVEQPLADKRAAICVTCPRNVAGAWYTTAPAELIRAVLSSRADLKLATPSDDRLQSCDVCKCLMRLKVWTPLDYIVTNTKPEVMAEFPSNCWIKNRDA